MQLYTFMSAWACQVKICDAPQFAQQQGYDGFECALPKTQAERELFRMELNRVALPFIAEVVLGGGYVPNRRVTAQQQLDELQQQLAALKHFRPLKINCLGSCDAWPADEAVYFFQAAIQLAEDADLNLSFETHRGRSLYSPWQTQYYVEQIPKLRLTLDMSHWYVVCEGLQAPDFALIKSFAPRVDHIHARVGYDQGPQVPTPYANTYLPFFERHMECWQHIWRDQRERNMALSTISPEFGPDGYQYRDVTGKRSLVNLIDINNSMRQSLQHTFGLEKPQEPYEQQQR